jgi:ABC-type tungstate transport system permease subunit
VTNRRFLVGTLAGLIFLAGQVATAAAEGRFFTLASTTSTEQSGLFGSVVPAFEEKTGIDVRVVAVGTGQALKLGEKGDADALLVHDRAGEDRFVADGFGIDRRDVMYNDFLLIGPAADPAGIKGHARRRWRSPGSPRRRRPSRRAATTAARTGWSCAYGRRPAWT